MVSNKIAPELSGVSETLLIPLWARANEQSRPDPLIRDPHSARIANRLNYDFASFQKKRVEAENFCARSRVVDEVVSAHLKAHPKTTVVEFGPGLDTRFQRLGHLAARWVEVDLPEVIALRQRFFESNARCTTVSGSMLDGGWMQACGSPSRPPLLLAEGVFYFFSKQQIRDLLNGVRGRFPGASFIFDTASSWYLRYANRRHPLKDSRLRFSLNSGAAEIADWASGWRVSQYVGYGDSPWYDPVMPRMSWWKRAAVRYLRFARHAFMIVRATANLEQVDST